MRASRVSSEVNKQVKEGGVKQVQTRPRGRGGACCPPASCSSCRTSLRCAPGRDCLICGLDCLICGLGCLISGLDCLISGLDCLICGLDCLICVLIWQVSSTRDAQGYLAEGASPSARAHHAIVRRTFLAMTGGGTPTLISEPETRNPKPETRNPKPETRNPKPETLTPKPQGRRHARSRSTSSSCSARTRAPACRLQPSLITDTIYIYICIYISSHPHTCHTPQAFLADVWRGLPHAGPHGPERPGTWSRVYPPNPKPETRQPKTENRKPNPETQNRKTKNENLKPESRIPNPESRIPKTGTRCT